MPKIARIEKRIKSLKREQPDDTCGTKPKRKRQLNHKVLQEGWGEQLPSDEQEHSQLAGLNTDPTNPIKGTNTCVFTGWGPPVAVPPWGVCHTGGSGGALGWGAPLNLAPLQVGEKKASQ